MLLLLVSTLLIGCEKDESNPNYHQRLVGKWKTNYFSEYVDEFYNYSFKMKITDVKYISDAKRFKLNIDYFYSHFVCNEQSYTVKYKVITSFIKDGKIIIDAVSVNSSDAMFNFKGSLEQDKINGTSFIAYKKHSMNVKCQWKKIKY